MATWEALASDGLKWSREIINLEGKLDVAERMAARLREGDIVGVGSGSTSFLTIQALARRAHKESLSFCAIPTSAEVEMACAALGVKTTTLSAARPDWSFDGADEVDGAKNMIKGRGGALLREKLMMTSSPERYIVVDRTKLVDELGTRFPIPVEVIPEAVQLVRSQLAKWPTIIEVAIRLGVAKDGPVITELGNYIVDIRLNHIVPAVAGKLKQLSGVVESGLFVGYRPRIVVAE